MNYFPGFKIYLGLILLIVFACSEDNQQNAILLQNEMNIMDMTTAQSTASDMLINELSGGEQTAGDTMAGDTMANDTMAADTTEEEDIVSLSIDVLRPQDGQRVPLAQMEGLEAIINIDPIGLAPFVSWTLTSTATGSLPVLFESNQALIQADLSNLPNVDQTLILTARVAPDTEQSIEIPLTKDCQLSLDFERDLDLTMWKLMGSASRDSRGWLEMTAFQTQTTGGIFLIGAPFNPGDLDVAFQIASGACDEIGTCMNQEIADGYAMSIWNIGIDQIDSLWGLLGSGGNGASLSTTRLDEAGLIDRPEGLTIEFDTYPNSCPNNGFYDPVQSPHIEIYFDGRYYMSEDDLTREERCMITMPGEAYPGYWSETPQLRDNQWHDVRVIIQGNQIQVFLDEESVVNTSIPNFEFKGGVLAFSGGSGAIPAFQRFDNLQIGSGCNNN